MKALEPNEIIAAIQRRAEHDAITIGMQRIDRFFDEYGRQAWAVAIHEDNTFIPSLEQRPQACFQNLPDIIGLPRDEGPIRAEEFAQRRFSAGRAEQGIALP